MNLHNLKITNPKRQPKAPSLYSYYAGYSLEFANNIIQSAKLSNRHIVMDPWNGGGTTTKASSEHGVKSLGIDLNPVMVLVAKANLINPNEFPSIEPISQNIVKKARTISASFPIKTVGDPLGIWFTASSVESIRKIEKAIQLLLIDDKHYEMLAANKVNALSSIAAFYYVALFRSVRQLLKPFLGSNPTWVKKTQVGQNKLRPTFQKFTDTFLGEVMAMINQTVFENDGVQHERSDIHTGSSTRLDIQSKSVDFVLTSPPYCTRIDYAVSTLPELSILGYGGDAFRQLRTSMIGTTTVDALPPIIDSRWGEECQEFLTQVHSHGSKASTTYYYKNHLKYFDSVFKSMSEVSRVLKPSGAAIFVVQNSYYKDVYNDLCKVYIQMAQANGLELVRKEDFQVKRAMAGLKKSNSAYRGKYMVEESVLCFSK